MGRSYPNKRQRFQRHSSQSRSDRNCKLLFLENWVLDRGRWDLLLARETGASAQEDPQPAEEKVLYPVPGETLKDSNETVYILCCGIFIADRLEKDNTRSLGC